MLGKVPAINDRFRRLPYHTQWASNGALADAAVLVHIFDGWEEHEHGLVAYRATPFVHDGHISTSLIYADQRPTCCPEQSIPVYTMGSLGVEGIIFKPGESTRIMCGSAADTGGGECRWFCDSVPLAGDAYDPWRDGRDGCGGGSWRPEDFGVFLRRSCSWQKEVQALGRAMDYNEIIVDGPHWNDHLPNAIEAFFGYGELSREQHRMYLDEFSLTPEQVPLLTFNWEDWESPFSLREYM